MQLGLLGAPLESADAAVAAKPTWPKAHYRRGVALSAIELWPEASRAFERALAAEPGNKQLQSAAARAREKCGALPRVGGAYTLTWGRGEFGALGHGDVRDRALPRALEAARGMVPADGACGTGHTLLLTDDGDVLAWGWNTKGQCGVPPCDAVPTPTLIGPLLGAGVRGVACGAAHSLAVTARGGVLSWGLGGSGQLGHGDLGSSEVPRPIAGLASEAVQGIACGFGHTVALTTAGALFSWGWNRDGQLGLGDTENRPSPCRLGGVPACRYVACGGAHSAVVSTAGELHTFGLNTCGQAGVAPDGAPRVLRPHRVGGLREAGVVVALAACGEEYTVVLSDAQDVLTFGLNNVGQLGAERASSEVPGRVEAMAGAGSECATCGASQARARERESERERER